MGKRLFVSVDCTALADEIAAVQEPFRDRGGLRPTDPEQAHLTLKFLGDTPAGRTGELTDALEAAVADAAVGPFEAELAGYGVFPSPEYISVVWLGVGAGSEELTRLHEAVEERTTDIGFDPEDHEFTPHVTLARMDHAGGKEHVQRVVGERAPEAGRLSVDAVDLTESTLTDDGPVYEAIASVSL
jgi:2'-5' RNA ligase